MMYSIHCGNVSEYTAGIEPLVYLETTVERLLEVQCDVVSTDRNAVLALASFHRGLDSLNEAIDWPLMRSTMWNNTADEPDRMERRMAECLAHRYVPWTAFTRLRVSNRERRRQAQSALGRGAGDVQVHVTPRWYF